MAMVDLVVHRHEMRATLARLCKILTKGSAPAAATEKVAAPAVAPWASPM